MPWKEHGVMEERFRFIEEWNSGEFSLAELCRSYGISRGTGYKWIVRYEAQGLDGLCDLSRAPHHHPNEISQEIEEQIIAVRSQHPSWGAPKIHSKLMSVLGPERIPAESTIGAVLQRNGLTVSRKRRRSSRRAGEPLAHAGAPNTVWCADYKGWFRTADGTRIEPLTITDAYSRYLLRCQALAKIGYALSKPVFEAAFREYGLPARIRTDNGPPFGSNGDSGLTELAVWWIKLGITPERIAPGKPQQNGRHERMHRTLKQETASPPAKNRRAQQRRFDEFRNEYNEDRPHEALGQTPPSHHYEPSARVYPERLPSPEYPRDWTTRSVREGGRMCWKTDQIFVTKALEGERVGLEQIDERSWRVWFSWYEIGVLDEAKQKILRPKPTTTDDERHRP